VDPDGEESEVRSRIVLIGTGSTGSASAVGMALDRICSGRGQNGDNADEKSSRSITLFPSVRVKRE
jgi:hypothetical protein